MRNFDDRAAKRTSQQGEGIDRQLVRLFQPAIAKFRREPAVYALVVEHVGTAECVQLTFPVVHFLKTYGKQSAGILPPPV